MHRPRGPGQRGWLTILPPRRARRHRLRVRWILPLHNGRSACPPVAHPEAPAGESPLQLILLIDAAVARQPAPGLPPHDHFAPRPVDVVGEEHPPIAQPHDWQLEAADAYLLPRPAGSRLPLAL